MNHRQKKMTQSAYTFEEMEPQYNFRARRPDYGSVVEPDWVSRSERFRTRGSGRLDLRYGPGERDRLDFFPSQVADSPIVIFFHGGYWQRGDKSLYSFLAEPFVKNGISVALVNYMLCPDVRVSDIVPQAQRAVAWIHDKALELGGSPDKLYIMGHSAGGHITAMLMSTDWSKVAAHLPRKLIKGGIPISALFDLVPLLYTSINNGLNMDAAEAIAQSPIHHPPLSDAPMLLVYGGAETEHLKRQSEDYASRFTTENLAIKQYEVPGCDHFDVLNALSTEDSECFTRLLALINAEPA
ncbi:MAG TPA: alpha/beta hydrolase [Burkholderiaceae bacterium]|nr:alpha/beta hydrolase [Burkholderiaceae bacterium]